MKKRLLTFMLAFVLAISGSIALFAGCSGKSNEPSAGDNNAVTSVTVTPSSFTMVTGEKKSVSATVAPASAKDKKLTWNSTNTAVADYINGEVVALGEGTCIIKAAASNGVTGTCTVTVGKAKTYFSSVAFSQSEYWFSPGYTFKTELILPNEISDSYEGTAVSSDPSVVAVTYEKKGANGIELSFVTKKDGTVTVTVTLEGGAKATAKIICKNVTDEVTVTLPKLPQTCNRWRFQEIYYTTRIDSIEVNKYYNYVQSDICIDLKLNYTQIYAKEGGGAVDFWLLMFNDTANTREVKEISDYTMLVGAQGSSSFNFHANYQKTPITYHVELEDKL